LDKLGSTCPLLQHDSLAADDPNLAATDHA
jgi:hypothetical protein